jgi:pimeloyl-ACP methyl ester carboxylesterase
MHSGFEQFHAFDQDVIDNKTFLAKGSLPMPVLAIGGERSFEPMMATVARAAATNVKGGVIPDSGHWLMEEQPQATVSVIVDFLR